LDRANDLLHAILNIEVIGLDRQLAVLCSAALAHDREGLALQRIVFAIVLERGDDPDALNGHAEVVLQQNGETVVLGLRLVALGLEALGDGHEGRRVDHALCAEDSL